MYEKFMKTEYNIESAVAQCGSESEMRKQLEVANTYNFVLHVCQYYGHLEQLETLRNVGDINEFSMLEMLHYMPELETLGACEQEIGNYSPECYVENGIFTRLCT